MATRSGRWRNKSDERMSLGEHLRELRKRLFISAVAILVTAVAGFFVAPYVIEQLRIPIEAIAEARNAETRATRRSPARSTCASRSP